MKTRNYSPAKIRSASFNADDNTIDVVWSTGADVQREDWDGPYVERLLMGTENVRLDRLNNGAPLLDSHQSEGLANVIGSVVPGTARIEGGKGVATIKLSSAASDSDTITKISSGVIRNISVGYWTHAQTRSDDSPPIVTATDWEPLEISAVPIPADPGARIRSVSHKRPRDRQTPAQRAAAYASRLLSQTTQSTEQTHGAAEARKALGNIGRISHVERVAKMERREIENGARAARRILRKRA